MTCVVGVPAGAVDEIQIVRNLDEAHARLNETAREEAALAKFSAVAFPERRGFLAQLEVAHEIRTGEPQRFPLRVLVVAQRRILGQARLQGREQALTLGRPTGIDALRWREAGRPRFRVHQMDVAMAGTEETGT